MKRPVGALSASIAALVLLWSCLPAAAQPLEDESAATIESYRAQILTVADLFARVGSDLNDPRIQQLAGEMASSAAALTDEDVTLLVTLGADLTDLAAGASALSEVVAQGRPSNRAVGASGPSSATSSAGLGPNPLPNASYSPTCPPPRTNTLALQIALNTLQVARTVLAIAQRGCDLVVVVCPAPGGGNPQTLACSPFDIALDVAQAVLENFLFCIEDIDSAEILGSYNRLEHIHDDLDLHDANIDSDLAAHDLNIDTDLAAHDLKISTQLAVHDLDLKTQLATHDADIKALLGNIQATVDENQRLLKISMARQLETMRNLITPAGKREIDDDVLTCTGADCPDLPAFQFCPNGSLKWNCKP